MAVESILLAVTSIVTFKDLTGLTHATGFYFERDDKLFVITNRHVVRDEATNHFPDRLEILLHTEPDNLTQADVFSLPLYDHTGKACWKEAVDSNGTVDVVAIYIDKAKFTSNVSYWAFNKENLAKDLDDIEIGESLRVIGYPLGFKDDLHNLPVMRHAIIASSFSLRFRGNGYFLIDSLLHRGSSGSPVVARLSKHMSGRKQFPWVLLGIHSARLNSDKRDPNEDERLNLSAAWYTDVLLTLTE